MLLVSEGWFIFCLRLLDRNSHPVVHSCPIFAHAASYSLRIYMFLTLTYS